MIQQENDQIRKTMEKLYLHPTRRFVNPFFDSFNCFIFLFAISTERFTFSSHEPRTFILLVIVLILPFPLVKSRLKGKSVWRNHTFLPFPGPWYLYQIVYLKTHGASIQENRSFRGEKKIRFVTALDLTKCLEQIKYQGFFLTCAPCYHLIKVPCMH